MDTIYIGKDTPVAYIKGEDAGCEYLEVNEIIEDVRGINWKTPPPMNVKWLLLI